VCLPQGALQPEQQDAVTTWSAAFERVCVYVCVWNQVGPEGHKRVCVTDRPTWCKNYVCALLVRQCPLCACSALYAMPVALASVCR